MEKYGRKYHANISFLIFSISFLICFIFAYYTEHAWEDWYITYRSSKNLATGNGLVYSVGERIHSFTSPIGTLIPAALNLITGNASDNLVLWLYRLINGALVGFTAVILYNMAIELHLKKWSQLFLVVMFAFDAKTVDFSINGMETGFMVFFIALSVYSLLKSLRFRGVLLGIAWGGLMWTRPDSFVYIVALAVGFLIFNPKEIALGSRADLARLYCVAAIVTTLIYLPWLVWTWTYFGSFVPHTVVAKGLFYWSWLMEPGNLFSRYYMRSLWALFSPSYVEMGGWPYFLYLISLSLALIAAIAWLVPGVRLITRALACAVFICHIYLNLAMEYIYPWYLPSVAILSILVLALIIDQGLEAMDQHQNKITNWMGRNGWIVVAFPRVVVLMPLVFAVSLTLSSAYQLRVQQAVIEEGNRKKIGLWLQQHATSPRDRVFVEALGYIGFYSGLKMYDFPGLSSLEVVAARRALKSNEFGALIEYLEPDWLVLRPKEVDEIVRTRPAILSERYSKAEVFDVSQRVASYRYMPGRDYLEYDQIFLVFRRQ